MTDRVTDPWTEQYGTELAAIIADALPRLEPGGGAMPAPRPAPGQSHADWAAEVATIRARHDSSALDAGVLLSGILTDALGPDAMGIGPTTITTAWAEVTVPGGTVGLRLYRPDDRAGPFPVVALIHGGAYWMGGGAAGWQLNDSLCRKIAAGVGAVVVNIDHRLAPEHPYPTPVDDVVAALSWIVAHAEEYALDAARLAIFGISSGGNLAAAAAHRALDGAAPAPAAVVLQSPSLHLSSDSGRFEADEASVEGARRIVELYAGEVDPNGADVSPGLRGMLTGLPPTLIITADFDPLAADAERYAARLDSAGVDVTRHPYPMTHTVATPSVFRRMHDDTVVWLREVLG